MVIRKLLWLGLLSTVGQFLIATASTEQTHDPSKQNSSSPPTQPSPTNEPGGSLAPSTQETPSTEAANPSEGVSPAIRNPLLSTLILPLPPLLLPDLLLPPYDFPSFSSERLDQELQIYSRYLRIYGAPDVLIVGSSRSLQGIDPSTLQAALAEQGYSDVTVFNFGINGATAQVIDVLLRDVLTQEQLPRMIIWGDGLRAFNDGRPDLTYEAIVASDGYRRLATGDRPIPPRVYYQEPSTLRASNNKALANSSAAPTSQRVIAPDLDMYGFQTITQQFDPSTYYSQYPRVPGNYDSDYVPFALGNEQTAATISIARFAQEQNISLVVVNLPLTQAYMDAPRLQYEQQFHQHLQGLAQRENFTLIDLVQHPDLIHNHYFADPSHINAEGAKAVALHLATHPQISWQMLQPSSADSEPQ